MEKVILTTQQRFLPATSWWALTFAVFLFMAVLSSCSSGSDDIADNPVNPNPTGTKTAIGFSGYIPRSVTRGIALNSDSVGKYGFGIFAFYSSPKKYGRTTTDAQNFQPNFMDNISVTNADGKGWTYSPIRYWPNTSSEYISFLAYAPYTKEIELVDKDGKASTTENNATYIHYQLEDDKPEATTDWMFNTLDAFNQQLNDKSNSDLDNENRVKLQFKHATSRLGIAFTSTALQDSHNFIEGKNESDASITINKFIVGHRGEKSVNDDEPGAKANGIAVRKAENVTDGSDMTGAFYSAADLNLDPTASDAGKWSNIDSTTLVSFTISDFKDRIQATRISTKGDGKVNTITNASDEYLFIIPQKFIGDSTTSETGCVPGGKSGGGPKVANHKALECFISYTVNYDSNAGTTGAAVTYNAYGEISHYYEAGKAYQILIDIGNTGTDPNNPTVTSFARVTYNVSEVSDWGNEEQGDLQ